MRKKIDLYLENLYLIKNMFEDDPIALPAIEELIEKAEHCKKKIKYRINIDSNNYYIFYIKSYFYILLSSFIYTCDSFYYNSYSR